MNIRIFYYLIKFKMSSQQISTNTFEEMKNFIEIIKESNERDF